MKNKNYFHILRKRLITLGIKPKDARVVSLDFDKQVKSMGIYNALDYYKRVGDQLIAYLSKSGVKVPWVKTINGFPTHLIHIKEYPLETLLRVAKMARLLELSSPTKAMTSKLKEAAESEPSSSSDSLHELSRLISLGVKLVNFSEVEFPNSFSTVIKQSRTFVSRSVPNGTAIGLDIKNILSVFTQWKDYIVTIPNWDSALYPLHPSWVGRKSLRYAPYQFAGEIGGVMENGGKLRLFAAPSVLLQAYLEPLQKWLDGHRDQVATDVYRNQESGALWAQEQMRLGKSVQSIDLSSATCRFPFSVQLQLCKDLGAPTWSTDLYEAVSRESWKCQPHMAEWLEQETIRWTVGQPLGVNPSMSSFALCHNLLMVGLCSDLDLDWRDSFRIMGDDVVTSNPLLASRYRSLISDLGIKISEHKSFNSNEYAEFAGFSITPDVMIRPGRWRLISKTNVLGLVENLGPQVIDEMSQDNQKVARILAFKQGMFTPPVSEYSDWVKLCSLVFTPSAGFVFRDREVTWYDGAVRFLSNQFDDCYYVPPWDIDLMSGINLPDKLDQHIGGLCRTLSYLSSWHSINSVVSTVLTYGESLLEIQELCDLITNLKVVYENYLWSIPRTSGYYSRSEWDRVQSLVIAQ